MPIRLSPMVSGIDATLLAVERPIPDPRGGVMHISAARPLVPGNLANRAIIMHSFYSCYYTVDHARWGMTPTANLRGLLPESPEIPGVTILEVRYPLPLPVILQFVHQRPPVPPNRSVLTLSGA